MDEVGEVFKRIPEAAVIAAISIVALLEAYNYVHFRWPKVQAADPKTQSRLRWLIAAVVVIVAFGTAIDVGIGKPRSEHTRRSADDKFRFINREGADAREDDVLPTQLKALVKQSRLWEVSTLYASPWSCDANNLQQYWAEGSEAYESVGEAASGLSERRWHYGPGSKLLSFEFRYARVSPDGASAEIGTREHWWLILYDGDARVVPSRNPDQGPYEIDYLLVKINRSWYVKSSNAPYSQWNERRISCKNWNPRDLPSSHYGF